MAILSNINDKFAVDSTGAIKFNGQAGTSGYILKSNGNAAPTWVDPGTVIGGPYLPLTGGTLTGNLAINGSNSLTVGGTISGSGIELSNYMQIKVDDAEIYWTNTANNDYWRWRRDASNNFICDHYNGSSTTAALTFDTSQNATFAGQVTTSQPNSGLDYPILIGVGNSGSGVIGYQTRAQFNDIHNTVYNIDAANSSSSQWLKVGTLSNFGQSGYTFVLTFYGHTGYNASNTQDYNFKLFLKTSNGNAGGPHNAFFNTWVENTGNNTAAPALKWVNTNSSGTPTAGGTSFVLYMNVPQFVSGSIYTVDKHSGNWTSNNTTGQSDPGNDSTTVLQAENIFNILNTNVGIGTTSPNKKLTVYGGNDNGIWVDSSGSRYTSVAWGNNGSEKANIAYDNTNANFALTAYGASNILFTNNGSERMRIDANGNVAIQPGGATLTNTRLNVVALDNYDPSLYDGMGGIRIGTAASGVDGSYTGGIGFAIASGTSGIAGVQKGADSDKQGLAFFTHPSTTGGDAAEEKMRLDADGNVGIGTTSPSSKLVVRTSTDHNFEVEETGGELRLSALNNARSANIGLQFAASEFNFLTGSVGIGTTSPTTKLSVSDGAAMYANSNYLVQIKRNATNGDDNTSKASILLANNSNAMQIAYGGTTDRLRFIDGGAVERFTMLNGGNVGIGTTVPSYKLEVNGGTALVGGGFYVSNDQTILTSSIYTFRDAVYINNPNSTSAAVSANSVMSIGASSGNSVNTSLITTGAIGIGNTSPQTTLHAGPTTTITNVFTARFAASNFFASGGNSMFYVPDTAANIMMFGSNQLGTNQIEFYHKNPGTSQSYVGRISTSSSATSYVTSSDYRLKENIVPISDSISRLNQLKPSRFNFIEEPNKTVDGFIAHEVQNIVPEAIVGKKDAVNEDGSIIPQGIDQAKLVPLLVAAIQELEARVKELENK